MVDATVLGALGSDARTTAMSSRVFGAAHVAGRAEITVTGSLAGGLLEGLVSTQRPALVNRPHCVQLRLCLSSVGFSERHQKPH